MGRKNAELFNLYNKFFTQNFHFSSISLPSASGRRGHRRSIVWNEL